MPRSATKPLSAAALAELDGLRREFQAQMSGARTPQHFASRVGVVLSGGGARGAYEAGVLMAFQDAHVPTHIITATSVGSINAASYAAHSTGLVGDAEPLVQAWMDLTPATLGIDWSRYIFVLAGLIAASAGVGNFLWEWFKEHHIYLHAHHPKATWLALAGCGLAILLFADKLSYIFYVILNFLRGRKWEPDRRKAWVSFGASLLVLSFPVLFLGFTHIHVPVHGDRIVEFSAPLPLVVIALVVFFTYRMLQDHFSRWSHRFLRLPLRTGLFPNFDRIKFLRQRIPQEKLRSSDIRVVMTATDLRHGVARYFSNCSVEKLANDPGAQQDFVRREVEQPDDLVQAAVASSSYTFAYEAVPMAGRLWTDGGIMTNQPMLPALRLGADVLFLVLISPLQGALETGEIRTFLDVGLQAVDILISKNFKTDIALLSNFNRLCSLYAADLGVRPEQLELEIGSQRYRYVKAFHIAPKEPLPASALDFDGEIVGPVIVQGYKDATKVIGEFLAYEQARPARESRRVVRLEAERIEGNFQAAAKSQSGAS